jgi:hypothetical protein
MPHTLATLPSGKISAMIGASVESQHAHTTATTQNSASVIGSEGIPGISMHKGPATDAAMSRRLRPRSRSGSRRARTSDTAEALMPPTLAATNGSRTPDFAAFSPPLRDRRRGQMQAVRLGDHMGLRYDIQTADDDFEIYNVAKQPGQADNLGADPAFASLQERLKRLALQARRPDPAASRPYDSALVPAEPGVTADSTQPGLTWHGYSGPFPWVPAFETLTPAAGGTTARPDASPAGAEGLAGLFFSGYLVVPRDGDYTFHLQAGRGALLRLDQATLLDADFGYRPGEERSARARLQAGLHAFRLYVTPEAASPSALELAWSGPGFDRTPIPASAFRHP